jgi:thiamine kinase-like enzyme
MQHGGTIRASWGDRGTFDQRLQSFAQQFARFIDQHGEMVPFERRDLYQRLLDQAPRLIARFYSHRNLTVIHGDAHPWNFFLSRNDGFNVRLIDWENWSIDTATDDLAYMMAMLWYPDRRRRMERALLDLYHGALLEKGVSAYSRQALDDDYRLSVLWLITRPVVQAMANIGPAVWWNNLERIMLAVDDLGCRDLLV